MDLIEIKFMITDTQRKRKKKLKEARVGWFIYEKQKNQIWEIQPNKMAQYQPLIMNDLVIVTLGTLIL